MWTLNFRMMKHLKLKSVTQNLNSTLTKIWSRNMRSCWSWSDQHAPKKNRHHKVCKMNFWTQASSAHLTRSTRAMMRKKKRKRQAQDRKRLQTSPKQKRQVPDFLMKLQRKQLKLKTTILLRSCFRLLMAKTVIEKIEKLRLKITFSIFISRQIYNLWWRSAHRKSFPWPTEISWTFQGNFHGFEESSRE